MLSKLAARRAEARSASRRQTVHQVTIKGELVSTATPEGQPVCMKLKDLLGLISTHGDRSLETGGLLPDGVKLVRSRGPVTVWTYQRPPQVHNLRWIAADSPVPFGKGSTYRSVRIALPYLVVLAVFITGRNNRLQLSQYNECFFRNEPLKSVEDQLFYPALLNCSKFNPQEGHPLSWICTANMDLRRLGRLPDENERMRGSMNALLHCLLETGYNHSSEHHEETSWFTESATVDPRVATVERWEQATAKDSLFVLDVPWLKTGRSLGQVIERIFDNAGSSRGRLATSNDLMRLMANNSERLPAKEEAQGVFIDELF